MVTVFVSQWMKSGLVRLIWLGIALFVSLVAAAIVEGISEITVCDDSGGGTFFTVDFESNYLPNVVRREIGAASFEALKAQAVPARTIAFIFATGDNFRLLKSSTLLSNRCIAIFHFLNFR